MNVYVLERHQEERGGLRAVEGVFATMEEAQTALDKITLDNCRGFEFATITEMTVGARITCGEDFGDVVTFHYDHTTQGWAFTVAYIKPKPTTDDELSAPTYSHF